MTCDDGLPHDYEIGENADIIIVGAGIAGSALAYTLSEDGRRVRVIERDLTEPDRIVGELLQPGGYLKLMELELEDCVNEIDAQHVFAYAFVKLEQGIVTSLITEKGTIKGVQYKTKNGHELIAKAPLTIVCDGCFSNLRRSLCNPKIPNELYGAFISATDNGKIRTMPNRSMPAAPTPTPGALLMGDAFNMRHPLTGGGMTVALSDIVLLRGVLRPLQHLNDASALCTYLESFYTLRKPTASTINTLAGALYKLFSGSSDPARREMRQACCDYLSLGSAF
ncbi:hypothetical protein PTKIN_Ptkin08bG0092200 [Pterospermum kingtungense]